VIGQGAFGRVHRAKWRGCAVAVKMLICPKMTAELEHEFQAEVDVLSSLRHPNVCLFMGAVTRGRHRCLVTELAARGSLWDFMHSSSSSSSSSSAAAFDWSCMVQMAKDVACGMLYLHSHSPPILHRDLKSGNLLLDAALVVKLADFGLARIKATATMTANRGTFQWMAPECLANQRYTEKADVYRWGARQPQQRSSRASALCEQYCLPSRHIRAAA
jgi:serine/threonine protein kinase